MPKMIDSRRPLMQTELEFIDCPFHMKTEMNSFIDFMLKTAWDLGENAGYSGAMNDGGQRALEQQIESFCAGCYEGRMPMKLPKAWQQYVQQFNRQNADPKLRAEYERLKAMFGDA